MRLIDVHNTSFLEFWSRKKPKYTVLSHRWMDDEVSFADILDGRLRESSSLIKFKGFLRQTELHGIDFAWTDTCCIDKQSSAEQSEAINAMYKWYREAEFCYVYLHDVDRNDKSKPIRRSEWFKRGWTLQELLAPSKVMFYDYKWQFLGDKSSLVTQLSRITGIESRALVSGGLHRFSVAQKMSWAAKRRTTRLEDTAYCLMGLFDVNMPLLYGEGEKAFLRLQEEIIKHNDDHSIFTWSMGRHDVSGLLAPSPNLFRKSQHMVPDHSVEGTEPFLMTNRGLSISLEITPWSMDTYLAYLNCDTLDSDKKRVKTSIFLRRLWENDQYTRFKCAGKDVWCDNSRRRSLQDRPVQRKLLFVRQPSNLENRIRRSKPRTYGFKIVLDSLPPSTTLSAPRVLSDQRTATLQPGDWGCVAVLDVATQGLRRIALGFDFEFNPICFLEDSFSSDPTKNLFPEFSWDWSAVFEDDVKWEDIIEGRYVYRKKPHDGRWAVRGHRIWGLDVLLSESPNHSGSIMSLRRNGFKSSMVWEFRIDDLTTSFEEPCSTVLQIGLDGCKGIKTSYRDSTSTVEELK